MADRKCVSGDLRVHIEVIERSIHCGPLKVLVELGPHAAGLGVDERGLQDGHAFLPRQQRRDPRAEVLQGVRRKEGVIEFSGLILSEFLPGRRRIHA
ncbi:hypothetical protein [Nocardioides sp. B-3]|uniref:hypothetical protein n=1 Tax=Nocardioides sp. B-3 TaxID=2895565 RepID=UPI0021529307|nr:hypothetical protein [Nocardioides sp. B-3]UUZ58717.1 hypothetical protein LP418_21775 [Nocardioides sp. B-3]